MADSIETENAELVTPRELVRGFAGRMNALESGEVEKLVLMRGATMTAVVVPFERYVELLRNENPA
jgi:hypothetical protein